MADLAWGNGTDQKVFGNLEKCVVSTPPPITKAIASYRHPRSATVIDSLTARHALAFPNAVERNNHKLSFKVVPKKTEDSEEETVCVYCFATKSELIQTNESNIVSNWIWSNLQRGWVERRLGELGWARGTPYTPKIFIFHAFILEGERALCERYLSETLGHPYSKQ